MLDVLVSSACTNTSHFYHWTHAHPLLLRTLSVVMPECFKHYQTVRLSIKCWLWFQYQTVTPEEFLSWMVKKRRTLYQAFKSGWLMNKYYNIIKKLEVPYYSRYYIPFLTLIYWEEITISLTYKLKFYISIQFNEVV